MRAASTEKKGDPHLVTDETAVQSTSKRTYAKRPKRSKDQRLNLKRSYEAFLKAAKKAGNSMASVPSPSETWPMRPYAASV